MKNLIAITWISLYFSILSGYAQPQPNAIASVETAIPVFIGYTQKAANGRKNTTFEAKNITSLSAYEQMFGTSQKGYYLYESVKLFYHNGGKTCYVISVGHGDRPIQYITLQKGLKASQDITAQLVVVPDAVSLPEYDFYALQWDIRNLCAALKDRFALLDTRLPTNVLQQDLSGFRKATVGTHFSWSAVYYPWLSTKERKNVPPSGAIAGIYAMQDRTKGVWKAPANLQVKGITKTSVTISQSQQTAISQPTDGKSLNPILPVSGKGISVWGARTLAGNDSEWKYVPVRRLAIMMEQSIRKSMDQAVFEPNDANTWAGVKATISPYLNSLWRQGAMQGANTNQAYFVKCGLGETMTAQDIQEDKLIIEVGFAPQQPAEFIIIRMEFKTR